MKILVVSAMDGTNLSIENVLREFIRRGHYIEVFARYMDHKNIRMFLKLSVPVRPAEELTDKIVSRFDVAFCGTDAMGILRFFDIYIFSYSFIFNGWASAGADFMFTLSQNRKMLYKEDCATMPIGVPKNDTPQIMPTKKQFLYIDAGHIPFGTTGKEQIANMLLDICKKFPDYQLVVKPRWLLNETENLTHPNRVHIYEVINRLIGDRYPDNLVLLNEHKDLQTLIDESAAVITTSISCYLDAALRKKGVIVVGGLSSEDQYEFRTNVLLKREYENVTDAGCLIDYRQVTQYLPEGIFCREDHLNHLLTCRQGASSHIVDVIEYVYETFLIYGRYPKIQEYNYESYKTDIVDDSLLNFNELKYKRLKNFVIETTRIFDSIDADIDYSDYFDVLEKTYRAYPLDGNVQETLLAHMHCVGKNIWIKEYKKLMNDPINQSLLLQALYDTGRIDDILTMSYKEVCCEGPYHYYLGMIYYKEKNFEKSLEHFFQFLQEANQRSFVKYECEKTAGIRECYCCIAEMYNGENMPPGKFGETYNSLCIRKLNVHIPYKELEKLYKSAVTVSQKLYDEGDFELASQCALRCLEQSTFSGYARMLDEENARIIHSLSYRIGRFITWLPRKTRKGFRFIKRIWTTLKSEGIS